MRVEPVRRFKPPPNPLVLIPIEVIALVERYKLTVASTPAEAELALHIAVLKVVVLE